MSICIPMLEVSAPISTIEATINSSFEKFGFQPTSKQWESIYNSVIGKDVFISIPTGSGKSLCYGLLPTVYNRLKTLLNVQSNGITSIVVIIFPLLSLMQDQAAKFNSMNIAAAHLGYNTNEELMSGKYELVFTSPENCLKHQVIFIQHLPRSVVLYCSR